MSKALLALAERCEREEAFSLLDAAIHAVMHGAIDLQDDLPAYTSSIDAAVTLEPSDAQEVCVRKYPKGLFYVRITTAKGVPVYCAPFGRAITEPMARCAAALRARAAEGQADTEEQVRSAASHFQPLPTKEKTP